MSGTERRWTLHICAECGERAHGPGSRCPRDRRRTWTQMTTVEVMPVSEHEALRDAARLVVDAEYRREQWGSDTEATFDRAIQALRESLK